MGKQKKEGFDPSFCKLIFQGLSGQNRTISLGGLNRNRHHYWSGYVISLDQL